MCTTVFLYYVFWGLAIPKSYTLRAQHAPLWRVLNSIKPSRSRKEFGSRFSSSAVGRRPRAWPRRISASPRWPHHELHGPTSRSSRTGSWIRPSPHPSRPAGGFNHVELRLSFIIAPKDFHIRTASGSGAHLKADEFCKGQRPRHGGHAQELFRARALRGLLVQRSCHHLGGEASIS